MMITTEALIAAGAIFVLRVVNNAVGTVRLITLARHQKLATALLGALEALLFAVTMAGVVTDLSNLLNLAAYCGGFAVGGWVGMAVESRFITSFLIVNVVASEQGHKIALGLREHGFGVTELGGEGKDGAVTMIRSVAAHRDVPRIMKIVRDINADAFVAIEEASNVQGGWLRRPRNYPQ